MILFRYDMIFLVLLYQIHNLSVLLVAILINSVKKQVPQVSFKTAAGDLISFHTFRYDMNIFGYNMILFVSDMIFLGSIFQIHNLSVLPIAFVMNSVKEQVPQVSYKTVAGDLIPFHRFGYILEPI